jgi:methionyl-tRNA formyltransferase
MGTARLVFAGTPDFAAVALRALIARGWTPVAAYTQPDRPAGRGRRLTPSAVKQVAIEAGIPVLQPVSLRDASALAGLRALDADLMVVAAYGLLLPPAALSAARLGCINIHASILPRWRGAAPIQHAILAGDAQTGISIMRMEAGLDTGPVYRTSRITIAADETGGSLHDRLARLGADTLIETLPGIIGGRLTPQPQDDRLATYANKIRKPDARIDWGLPAERIARQVRAFDPWPVAYTALGDRILRIWGAEALASQTSGAADRPGTVLGVDRSGIEVATGRGVLRITRLQAPGKRPTPALDFTNACKLDGAVLG